MLSMFIIYKTINKIDNHYYIGVHKTTDINDRYLGSGIRLRNAVLKYGISNFEKRVLFVFEDKKLAYQKEKELVNENILKDPLCYNLRIGGEEIDPAICRRGFLTGYQKKVGIYDESRKKEYIEKIHKLLLNKEYQNRIRSKNPFSNNLWQEKNNIYKNRQNNIDKIKQISEKMKSKSIGENNSQYRTMWIMNLKLKKNRKIKKIEFSKYFLDGWTAGRSISYT